MRELSQVVAAAVLAEGVLNLAKAPPLVVVAAAAAGLVQQRTVLAVLVETKTPVLRETMVARVARVPREAQALVALVVLQTPVLGPLLTAEAVAATGHRAIQKY
jgi:hypothetical protein